MNSRQKEQPISDLEEVVRCDFKTCSKSGKHNVCYSKIFADCSLYKGRFDTTGTYGRCH